MGDDGLNALAPALRRLPKLMKLNLTNNGISPAGARILASVIKSRSIASAATQWQTTLRSPRRLRRLHDASSAAISPLRRLILCHNPLLDTGLHALFDVLIDSPGLHALDLQNVQCTSLSARVVLVLLDFNRELAIVDLRGNADVASHETMELKKALTATQRGALTEDWLPFPYSQNLPATTAPAPKGLHVQSVRPKVQTKGSLRIPSQQARPRRPQLLGQRPPFKVGPAPAKATIVTVSVRRRRKPTGMVMLKTVASQRGQGIVGHKYSTSANERMHTDDTDVLVQPAKIHLTPEIYGRLKELERAVIERQIQSSDSVVPKPVRAELNTLVELLESTLENVAEIMEKLQRRTERKDRRISAFTSRLAV
ncbi:hypothetical protein BC832DRAFT_555819 [Gaertneriomyces semiglobifer]|nr:hypothetical protein BC832DRAFT_555819 [Gaertneriomyces semiglobifer]